MADLDRNLFITLYDKNGLRQGWVGDPLSVSVTERFLAMGNGEITVRATDPKLPTMLEDGMRVAVHFNERVDSDEYLFNTNAGYQLISGPLRNPRGSFNPGGSVTFQIESDWRILRNTRARVVPANPLEATTLADPAQSWDVGSPPASGEDTGRSGYFEWPVGPQSATEAVLYFIGEQVNTRYLAELGISTYINLAGAFGGPDVTASLPQVRFGTVEEYVVPLLQAAGIGMRIAYGELGTPNVRELFTDFRTPKVWSTVFTPESGVVRDGEWSLSYPEATHVAVGGPGDLSARAFYEVDDATGISAARNDIIDVFREATGAPVEWPTALAEQYRIAKYYLLRPEITTDQKTAFETFLQRAGAKALADGAGTSGVSLKLSESPGFRFTGGDLGGFAVGDIVTCAPSAETALDGLTFTDRITECTVAMSTSKGITVTPQMGKRSDDPDVQLALTVRALADAQSRKNTAQ